ncbi:50S ribosomal protein L31 [Nonomuraea sp. SBT364]|uniref:50S ribosomal protein L31 n=1 Tax=Nonomuraea sp. SBT364 TaxID=1580530 RepID=UPI00066E6DB4|nr:50S ribosomal protein L31 [Nonomuraea sp. SBT364]
MKKGIHPGYRPVVFRDPAEWTAGGTYPVVGVSSASHPLYTGRNRVLDTAGRVERFNQRYGRT